MNGKCETKIDLSKIESDRHYIVNVFVFGSKIQPEVLLALKEINVPDHLVP